ncbi:hypothetical protein HNO52_09080 [Billgrantia diversa]|uniref:hypothetical protein n=1 Tax=Halomonas sp. MCCC 1A13316 TaxID=2733487 RepID=UPI0018A3F1EB|nr:hypothetical protein [Halomonas sp. MCCC 1A13316]QOR37058.1 hypothetical protein HNO52_09080 [Halomonas sp. MCCC 1A13316]
MIKVFVPAGGYKPVTTLDASCRSATLGLTVPGVPGRTSELNSKESCMRNIIYIIGLIVVVLFILSMLGLR